MDTLEMMETNEQLEKIRGIVDKLRQGDLARSASSGALEAQLVRIWDITAMLQRTIVRPVVLEGYRQDAIDQVRRISDLIFPMVTRSGDDSELFALGMALQLAHQKVETYRRMCNLAAQTQILTGPPVKETIA